MELIYGAGELDRPVAVVEDLMRQWLEIQKGAPGLPT